MSKNKRKNKKSTKKSADPINGINNGNVEETTNKKEILDDSSIKKVTVTMENANGSTITRTEKKCPNGTIEHQTHLEENPNPERHHEHIHEEKNDYLETNIDKFDDKEIKSVTRTTKNYDGTITKKTTVVTTYPDGRLETKHTEDTFDPNEQNGTLDQNLDNEDTLSDQVDLDDKGEESESQKKIPQAHIDKDVSQISAEKKEPFYTELPSILSALPDYLVVPSINLDSGVVYNSDNYEILSKDEITNLGKLLDDNKDLGSEIMSKHVHLLNYYGNICIEKLKESLMMHLVSRNIFVKESDLGKCLKTIDHNLDGELNYIEFQEELFLIEI
ncbi:hypothetical protein BpHYR1_040355 [Brachionus plicatilis]|uniref:EF-hand domain-containing protein n=1 Tax=Brachionus plicatilis TaxID=10195 RepID=A0A3M7SAA1_BRAPC|nr:hypothetical protein BpHYR1_040355 [Brachionus plicatilis]